MQVRTVTKEYFKTGNEAAYILQGKKFKVRIKLIFPSKYIKKKS